MYSPLKIWTQDESDFFQAPVGIGADTGGVGEALFQFIPSAQFDSWLTIRADNGLHNSLLAVAGISKFDNTSKLESS